MKRLVKQIEATVGQWEVPTPNLWGFTQVGGEFEVLSNSGNDVRAQCLNEFIDLAGMSMREKTLFIQGLRVDYQLPPEGVEAAPGDQLNIIVMVTDVPASAISFVGPGFAQADMNMENCALMLNHTWTFTTDSSAWSSIPQLTAETVSGMMEATSSDRLYVSVYQKVITRKIGGTTSTLEKVTVPGLRIVCDIDAKEEAEYQYLMRLRRSYELNQS